MRHILRAILTLSAVAALVAAALPGLADPGDEAQFVALINQSRAAAGLGQLAGYADLTDDARVHTAEMIAAGQVFHSTAAQLGSYASGWALLGENVGMGPNPQLLHQAFMNSDSHRANVLGDYDLVGVGTDRSAEGVMFVTVVFMKSAAPAPTTTTTTTAPPPTPTTTAPPPPPTTTTTAPPATPTTAPPTTTTSGSQPAAQQPSPTTTTTSVPAAPEGLDREIETPPLVAISGNRPASKVAGAINERSFVAFRPVFGLLNTAGADPIVRYTSNGVPVTIE